MPEFDEFGIPIKKTTPEVEVDEFGIPFKKNESPNQKPVLVGSKPLPQDGGLSPFISKPKEEKLKGFGEVGVTELEKQGVVQPPPPMRIEPTIDPNVTQELREQKTQEDVARETKVDATSFDDGIMGTLKKAVRRGVLTGQQADALTVFEDRDDINFSQIAMIQNQLQNLRASDAYERFNKAQGFGEALQIMADNPIILAEQMLESLAAMTTHGQTRILAGAGTGAVMGSVVPVLGTTTGAGYGALSGMGLTSLNLEYSNDIISSLQESGIDITNPKDLEMAFSDDEKYNEVREKALLKGVPVALFDMLSAGIAGKIVSKPAKGIIKKSALGTAEVGVQGALGGAGEATGQIVSGEKINAPSILAEIVGEFGGGAPEIAIGAIVHKKKVNEQPTVGEVIDAAIAEQQGIEINEVLDTYEASELITPEQRVEIQSDIEAAKQVLSKVPETFTSDQKKRAAELIVQRDELQASIEGKDEALVKPQKEQIENINTQLEQIANEPITRDEIRGTDAVEEAVGEQPAISETGVEETVTEEVVLPEQGEEVQLEPRIKGGQPRIMVYDEGVWKEKVGNTLSEVSSKQQQEAQEKYANEKPSPEKMDVGEQARDGEEMGERNPQEEITQEGEEEVDALSSVEATAKALEGKSIGKEIERFENEGRKGEFFAPKGEGYEGYGKNKKSAIILPFAKIKTIRDSISYIRENNLTEIKDKELSEKLGSKTWQEAEDRMINEDYGNATVKGITVYANLFYSELQKQVKNDILSKNPDIDIIEFKFEDETNPNQFWVLNKDVILENSSKSISKAYHKAKADGSNPELVAAVEELLGKPQKSQAKPLQTEAESKAKAELSNIKLSSKQGDIKTGQIDDAKLKKGVVDKTIAKDENGNPIKVYINFDKLKGVLLSKNGKNIFRAMQGRFFIIARVGDFYLPFYISSAGTSGKNQGEWYPFFGYNNWLVKGTVGKKGEMEYTKKVDEVTKFLNQNLQIPAKYFTQFGQVISGGTPLSPTNVFYDINEDLDYESWFVDFDRNKGNTYTEEEFVADRTGLNPKGVKNDGGGSADAWINDVLALTENAELASKGVQKPQLEPEIKSNLEKIQEETGTNFREVQNVYTKYGEGKPLNEITVEDYKRAEAKRQAEKEPTEKQIADTAQKAGITPKNLRDLYKINRELFGLDRIKSLASAIAMDRMVGVMAKRANITKAEMYGRLKFEKASEEFVRGLSDRAKVLWQIVGENAQLAQDVRDNLQVARDMEAAGKDAKTIRLATGWEKGKDGKWRYEILEKPPFNVKLNLKFNQPKVELTNDKEATHHSQKLGDIINFPQLFEAYPKLKNLQVDLYIGGSDGVQGSYSSAGEYMLGIELFAENEKLALSGLLHEIQHAIQDIEGFAKGGSPESTFSMIEKHLEVLSNGIEDIEKNVEKYGWDKWTEISGDTKELLEQDKKLQKRLSDEVLKGFSKGKFDIYQRLAGEVEARNVEKRMGMTPEQRRETLLSETEDVARDEQIVLFDSKGIQMQVDAWHGSPYQFDKFTTEKIGTGEGAQAFGWGLYYSSIKEIAENYAKKLVPTTSNKRLSDSGRVNAKNLSKLLISEPFISKGFGGLDIPSRRVMISEMLGVLNQKEVFDSVVGFIPIDMVNMLVGQKVSANTLLNNPSMLIDLLPVDSNYSIPSFIQAMNILAPATAISAAIADGGSFDSKLISNELASAYRTNSFNHFTKIPQPSEFSKSFVYKVSLHKGKTPDQYTWLEWDKPLTDDFLKKFNKELSNYDWDDIYFTNDEDTANEDKKARFVETGEDLYKAISSQLWKWNGDRADWSSNKRMDKDASEMLLEMGIDGIKYPAESISRGATSDTARGFNYVVFDENAVSIEEVIKFQKDAEKARGAMMIGMDGQAVIYALTDPNVSTPLHEMAHVFEHYMTDAERAIVQSWAGTKGWTTQTSEKFARGFEKYLAEGKAPTSGLQKIFDKFKTWLTDIYNGITGSDIDIELNEPMREIYAKMLGAEAVKPAKAKKAPKSAPKVITSETIKEIVPEKTIEAVKALTRAKKAMTESARTKVEETAKDAPNFDKAKYIMDNLENIKAKLLESGKLTTDCKWG